MVKPSYLFKFEPFSEQTLKNLKEGVLFFSAPSRFNDPYDCNLEPGFIAPNDEETEKIRQHWIKVGYELNRSQKIELQNATAERIKESAIVGVKQGFNDHKSNFQKKRGVCCFSENNDDLLMWAHYGGNYGGFCLEFDTAQAPINKPLKVLYQNDIPKLNVTLAHINESPHIEDPLTQHIMSFFATKSLSWEYEQEWRCFHEEADKAYSYHQDALKSIYFGPRMTQTEKEIICLIMKGQNKNVKFFEGYQHPDIFKVSFKEVHYLDHLTAKSKNLL